MRLCSNSAGLYARSREGASRMTGEVGQACPSKDAGKRVRSTLRRLSILLAVAVLALTFAPSPAHATIADKHNDLTSDGISDIMATNLPNDCLYRWSGNGSGGIRTADQLGCGWRPYQLAAPGDINSDGIGDIVGISEGGYRLPCSNSSSILSKIGDLMQFKRMTFGSVSAIAPKAWRTLMGGFSRRSIALATALTIGASLTAVFTAGPAFAQCSIYANVPFKSGSLITAGGGVSGCSGSWSVFLERQRIYGWQTLMTVRIPSGGGAGVLRYNCSGTGTHTYRTLTTGLADIRSGTFRTSC
ncbi:FG-GAP repeat domain-containing protein [Plantactinospora solaniradicis]|uniref:FG-GAP repeat domain-containing protein n=1 Tax=Plantactinospora solaniradicis TaxID=1723736 RepID=A0ABW1KEL5_9ACTN